MTELNKITLLVHPGYLYFYDKKIDDKDWELLKQSYINLSIKIASDKNSGLIILPPSTFQEKNTESIRKNITLLREIKDILGPRVAVISAKAKINGEKDMAENWHNAEKIFLNRGLSFAPKLNVESAGEYLISCVANASENLAHYLQQEKILTNSKIRLLIEHSDWQTYIPEKQVSQKESFEILSKNKPVELKHLNTTHPYTEMNTKTSL